MVLFEGTGKAHNFDVNVRSRTSVLTRGRQCYDWSFGTHKLSIHLATKQKERISEDSLSPPLPPQKAVRYLFSTLKYHQNKICSNNSRPYI